MNIIKILLYPVALTAFAAKDSPIKSVNGVIDALNRIVYWTWRIFFIAAVFFILMAAFKFLTAQAEPEKINSAKKQILFAVIAIIIALLAISFTTIIENFLGGGGGSGSGSNNNKVYGPPTPQSTGYNDPYGYGYDPYGPSGINP